MRLDKARMGSPGTVALLFKVIQARQERRILLEWVGCLYPLKGSMTILLHLLNPLATSGLRRAMEGSLVLALQPDLMPVECITLGCTDQRLLSPVKGFNR